MNREGLDKADENFKETLKKVMEPKRYLLRSDEKCKYIQDGFYPSRKVVSAKICINLLKRAEFSS